MFHMKKVLKTACVLLILVMIFYNVPHLPVAAEDADSATPALLYDKAFMGVGERCNFDWLINIDSYYFTVADTSIAEYDETNRSYIIGKAPGTTSVSLTYIEGGDNKVCLFSTGSYGASKSVGRYIQYLFRLSCSFVCDFCY